jgi:hypothetical protein
MYPPGLKLLRLFTNIVHTQLAASVLALAQARADDDFVEEGCSFYETQFPFHNQRSGISQHLVRWRPGHGVDRMQASLRVEEMRCIYIEPFN